MVDECYALVEKWKSIANKDSANKDSTFQPDYSDIANWTSQQSVVFLESLQTLSTPLPPSLTQLMGRTYNYPTSANVELSSRFLVLGLKGKDTECCEPAAELLGKVGRMKFVRPLYRHLKAVDEGLARRTFEKNKGFYHPICAGMVEKDLADVKH